MSQVFQKNLWKGSSSFDYAFCTLDDCRGGVWDTRRKCLRWVYLFALIVGNSTYAAQNDGLLDDKSPPEGFIVVPEGVYVRGDNKDEPESYMERSRPVSEVYIDMFSMAETQVTYSQWRSVYDWAVENGYDFDNRGQRGADSQGDSLQSSESNDQHPVVRVNWYDVLKWCNAKSEKNGLTPVYYTNPRKSAEDVYRSGRHDIFNEHVLWGHMGYRLPTEAEWEKAARGGLQGKRWPWGDEDINREKANYWESENVNGTAGVGSYSANPYGLYDMAGNVWEWCWDWYGENYYSEVESTIRNPKGPKAGEARVIRGGSWGSGEMYHRCAYRSYIRPDYSGMRYGFRAVLGGGGGY